MKKKIDIGLTELSVRKYTYVHIENITKVTILTLSFFLYLYIFFFCQQTNDGDV